MKRIAVIYGGTSPEANISRKSARAVSKALKNLGYLVKEFELEKGLVTKLAEFSPDLVFPILHGSPGEDGTVQGFLECLGLPYVGEGVKVSALCMDKDWAKRLLETFGINTPRWVAIKDKKELPAVEKWNSFPAVVKPATGGSSVGLRVVNNLSELKSSVIEILNLSEKVLVEEFIEGREFTCGFAGGRIFTPLEIIPKKSLYDFETKYTEGLAEFKPVKGELREEVKSLTAKVVKALEIKKLCRVDFRYDSSKERLFVLEVNTIPGMTETSLLPLMAKIDGLTFEELIELIL
ncbi:MAG TPA: D-alanine--D-alanine ligase [Aquificales bacterium]|uniref:D-alanine--D-alanine ligase n=1 Tax=Aquifex aeolicus TaxID=63363 RepID=A0A9D1CFB2_AQUAO|nr:D-alanine--D-alanine ligase [Aquificales bacterium]HIP98695.1 D-alanine--D-alanine ligase [Aquifex aeolicus]